jgi:DNA-binding MurR/RpiR family transcriptional regulator
LKVARRFEADHGRICGMSVRKTAAQFEVNPSTVQRVARPFDAGDASVAAGA